MSYCYHFAFVVIGESLFDNWVESKYGVNDTGWFLNLIKK